MKYMIIINTKVASCQVEVSRDKSRYVEIIVSLRPLRERDLPWSYTDYPLDASSSKYKRALPSTVNRKQKRSHLHSPFRNCEESQVAEAVDEIVNDIDTTNEKLAEIELSLIPRSKPSTTLRQQASKAVKIFFASIFVITLYLYLLGVTEKFDLNMPAIGNCLRKHYYQQANCIFPERRQVINGIMCDVQGQTNKRLHGKSLWRSLCS